MAARATAPAEMRNPSHQAPTHRGSFEVRLIPPGREDHGDVGVTIGPRFLATTLGLASEIQGGLGGESGDLGYGPGSAGYVLYDLRQVPDPLWALASPTTKAMCVVVKVMDGRV